MTNEEVKRTGHGSEQHSSDDSQRAAVGRMAANEDVRWIWCHHGKRASSVIGYSVVQREPIETPEKRPIGSFAPEEVEASSADQQHL